MIGQGIPLRSDADAANALLGFPNTNPSVQTDLRGTPTDTTVNLEDMSTYACS
jgi:hypothetical protein